MEALATFTTNAPLPFTVAVKVANGATIAQGLIPTPTTTPNKYTVSYQNAAYGSNVQVVLDKTGCSQTISNTLLYDPVRTLQATFLEPDATSATGYSVKAQWAGGNGPFTVRVYNLSNTLQFTITSTLNQVEKLAIPQTGGIIHVTDTKGCSKSIGVTGVGDNCSLDVTVSTVILT